MKNNKFFLTFLTLLFITFNSKSYAMPSLTDIVMLPVKIITKPLSWWKGTTTKMVDQYKVEITYNLQLDGKPLTVVKAINCRIFEGVAISPNDGTKRPTRRAVASTRIVTHEIADSGEILILPVPGYCQVDKPYKEEVKYKNGKKKVKIIAIKNKTKSFAPISDKVIQSPAIVKFSKENPKEIEYIERIISPKIYKAGGFRLSILATSFKVESKENPINTELVDPEVANRFAWINGRSKSSELPRWGTYKEEDKGIYASFGMFKYPKEIWSRIPVINDFIEQAVIISKKHQKQQELIYLSAKKADNDKIYQGLDVDKGLKDIKKYLANLQSRYSIDRYLGRLGVNGDIETSILAKTIADSYGIMEIVKGKDIYLGQKWVPKQGKELEFQKLVAKSNYRDYYYPFTYNKKDQIWHQDDKKQGSLLIYKISSNKNANPKMRVLHRTTGDCIIGNKKYDKKTEFILFDIQNQELSLVTYGDGVKLKYIN